MSKRQEYRGDQPAVIVSLDEPTVATDSSTSAGEEHEFQLVPRLDTCWFLPAAGQSVSASTEDSINFAHLFTGDISKLLSELKRVNGLVPVLPLNDVPPICEFGLSKSLEVISSVELIHFEEAVVFADIRAPVLYTHLTLTTFFFVHLSVVAAASNQHLPILTIHYLSPTALLVSL